MEDRRVSSALIAGIAVAGCLLLLCCCFIPVMGGSGYYYWQRQQLDYWSTYDWGTWETAPAYDPSYVVEEAAWGDLRFIGDPTHIYTTASTTSAVLETRTKGEKVSYYGFDDTGMYFKVKTQTDVMGFVHLDEAEMEIYLGEVRVTAATAQVYETASDTSTILEQKYKGDMVPWYGFDASGNYYKVRNALDVEGYMKVSDAEIPW